ncbi:MAG: hypothetical protein ACFCGT_08260 [Sandaracinaceae bacterium]
MTGRVLGLARAAIAAGCSSPPPSQEGLDEPVAPPPPRPARPAAEQLYDADGVPLPSETRVAGLVLPVGLTPLRRTERRHIFTSRIPAGRLLRYFGPRLMTMEVERRGSRVTYRDATPRDAGGAMMHLDVTVEPTSGTEARVEIVERAPPPPEGTVVTVDEVQRRFREAMENRE